MIQTDHPEIVCLGEPMVEFVRSGESGSNVYFAGVGGDTSNAAIAASRQGAKVGYLTALGQDRFGDRVLKLWEREQIDAAAVARNADSPTGLYIIDPDPSERHFTYFRSGSAASLYSPADLPSEYLKRTSVLHLSGITLAVSGHLREAAFAAIEQIRANGGTVSLDTNLRLKLWDVETARQVTKQAAARANVLITSIEDSATLTGMTDVPEILQHYTRLGCSIVIVTRGEEGAILSVESVVQEVPPAPATPIDSTGAGDSFAGAFLAWWRETGDAWKAARLASIVAAGTVSGLGAVEPIPHRADVLRIAADLGIVV